MKFYRIIVMCLLVGDCHGIVIFCAVLVLVLLHCIVHVGCVSARILFGVTGHMCIIEWMIEDKMVFI